MPKKLTQEEFIEKAIAKHGDEFDYSKTRYVKSSEKVIITCKKHGDFQIKPNNFLMGSKCKYCIAKPKLNTPEFIKRAEEKYGNRFNYDKVNYIYSHTKVTITCNIHGDFEMTPSNFLKGNYFNGCRKRKKFTPEVIIKEAKKIHGDTYDYSNIKFLKKNIIIINCRKHGEFKQNFHSHITGSGCVKCLNNVPTQEEFIERLISKRGNEYDYSLVKYVNSRTPIEISCSIHGVFKQTPRNHLYGGKCPICLELEKITTETFIERSISIHGNKYNYDKVKYTDCKGMVQITCDMHGDFLQRADIHLAGSGCPTCNKSKGELKIRKILENKNIQFIPQKKFPDCKDIKTLAFDFYVPKLNLCIEFDGKQHFEIVEYFGGEKEFKLIQKRDEIKNNYCRDNNIKLLRIRYDQDIIEILDKELNG